MRTLSCHRPPIDRLTVVRALGDLHAQSPAFRDAVISEPEPFVGPEGTVFLDVRIGRDTAFRVVAPSANDAYALLHELIDAMSDTGRRTRGLLAGVPGGRRGALP